MPTKDAESAKKCSNSEETPSERSVDADSAKRWGSLGSHVQELLRQPNALEHFRAMLMTWRSTRERQLHDQQEWQLGPATK